MVRHRVQVGDRRLAMPVLATRTLHRHVPPGELNLDLLAARIRQDLTGGSIRRVVIDSRSTT